MGGRAIASGRRFGDLYRFLSDDGVPARDLLVRLYARAGRAQGEAEAARVAAAWPPRL
jgi:hypothetical protein